MKHRQWVVASVVLALAALVGCNQSSGSPRAEVGKRAPTFVAPRLVGDGDVRLTDYRGKPVLVNFFASWCTPCREELPLLETAGVPVIAVLFRDSAGNARRFLRELDVAITAVEDDGGIAHAYRVGLKPGLPLTYAISPDGKVAAKHIGQLRKEDVADLIAKAAG